MQVRFWGTRGSIAASITAECLRQKVLSALTVASRKGIDAGTDLERFMETELPFSVKGTYGTNTPCVEILDGDGFLLCDAGTGLRDFDEHLRQNDGPHVPKDFHLLLSHLHWDHIQGFPFFGPLYTRGNRVSIYGCHESMEKHLSVQHSQPFFPVPFNDISAELRFVTLQPEQPLEIAGFRVTPKAQAHPGVSYGFRVEKNGKTVVYSSDSEHACDGDVTAADPFAIFFRDADVLIFDAQYAHRDACTIRQNWGHSSSEIGVALATAAGVKHLCLFHMDSALTDDQLDGLLEETNLFASKRPDSAKMKITMTWDGMVLEV